MENNEIKSRKEVVGLSVISFISVTVIILILFYHNGFAPFGNNSFACWDANIDYLDIFAFLKDALSGKHGIGYSFSKVLGGNMLGVITTGYFSPLNLLLVFFDKAHLNDFFDIVVMLKYGIAAFTMAWFINRRFNQINGAISVALSVSYGLCQYNLAQASNIFFLEGMYMLPLFMLGTYYIVRNNSPYLLVFCVGYNIAFGWYTGAMNCIFTVIWALFEFFWYGCEKKQTIKSFLLTIRTFIIAAISGLLISMVFFYPTILCLRKSTEGSLDFNLFKDSFSWTV